MVAYPSKLRMRRTIQKSFHSLPLPVPVVSGSPLMYAGVTTRNIRRAVNIMALQKNKEKILLTKSVQLTFTTKVHTSQIHTREHINIFAQLSTNIRCNEKRFIKIKFCEWTVRFLCTKHYHLTARQRSGEGCFQSCLSVQGPGPSQPTWTYSEEPLPDMSKLVHYVACTVTKTGGWHSTKIPSC